MFFKQAILIATALATLAVATPTKMSRRTEPASSCSTGSLNCCNSSGDATDTSITTLLAGIGLPIGSVTGLVGVTCSPITGIGLGSSGCSSEALCCSNNSFKGAVALGCIPVDLSL
ncbi:hypothetical protein CCMSSC00406_0008355 [Pleurotus cornucopiae]|uniref:Uncharacterized protein n=1 Tax=Pleurotus cornucopiae TaxID=5321 RepID=A0ACB7J5R7_PLECO|nr:hypothetical protein CCMSSC00406_0008355 [Pleurotus cornucopiae]